VTVTNKSTHTRRQQILAFPQKQYNSQAPPSAPLVIYNIFRFLFAPFSFVTKIINKCWCRVARYLAYGIKMAHTYSYTRRANKLLVKQKKIVKKQREGADREKPNVTKNN